MHSPKNTPCTLDVTFYSTPDGRSEIYDFLWEHFPSMINDLNEKNVILEIDPQAPYDQWSKIAQHSAAQTDGMIQKFMHDKRFAHHTTFHPSEAHPRLEARIPAGELDHVLNAYNLLLDSFLSYIRFSSPHTRIDFSRVGENKIRIDTPESHALKIKDYLKTHCQKAPLIHQIRFVKPSSSPGRN